MGYVKRYVKRQAKRAKGYIKNRYAPGGRINYGRIIKDVAVLKNAINVEHKFRDLTLTGNPTETVPLIYDLTAIAQGTGASQRIGNSIKLNYCQLLGRIERNATNTAFNGPNVVRVLLVLDKEPISGALTSANFTDFMTTSQPHGLRNFTYATSGKWQVLSDKSYVLDGINRNTAIIKLFRKMETRVKYDNAGNMMDNRLHVVIMSDAPALSSEIVTTIQSRVKYVDN